MGKQRQKLLSLTLVIVLTVTIHLTSFAAPGNTIRVSVDSNGIQANDNSWHSDISSDGRYVVFRSVASNLVPGITRYASDIYLFDTQNGTTSRVSVASDGTEGNNSSYLPKISASGHFVIFYSEATNLVIGDTNDTWDVFLHDTQSGITTRVSVASDGTQANGLSAGGSISSDGHYVVFISDATNLVSGDTNGFFDVFLHDTQSGATTRVSVASDGTQANYDCYESVISADGRYVAFYSAASNLVDGDTNNANDVFLHDTQSGVTSRISVDSNGMQANGNSYRATLSSSGRYVAFMSAASNLVNGDTNHANDVFVHDTETGITNRVSVTSDGMQGNGDSDSQAFSADGLHIAFQSLATNMISGDTNGKRDVFVRDIQNGETQRVSVASDGMEGNNNSSDPAISANGRYVVFQSDASNLVIGDTNSVSDIFIHENEISPTVMNRVYLPLVLSNAP